jgi:hypothetical protein
MKKNKYNNFSPVELNSEIWKDVLGFEGIYRVSDLGRVKRVNIIKKIGPASFIKKEDRILIPVFDVIKKDFVRLSKRNKVRLLVNLSKNGKIYRRNIHRLVLEAFVGSCPAGMETCHNDGNPLNNRLWNLRWDTHRNNEKDKIKHGTSNRGEKSHLHKLNLSDIKKIRKLYKTKKYSTRKLGILFNVSHQNISCIITRKSWGWLQ